MIVLTADGPISGVFPPCPVPKDRLRDCLETAVFTSKEDHELAAWALAMINTVDMIVKGESDD